LTKLDDTLEQFQALVELKKFDANNELPFRAIMRAAPNLKGGTPDPEDYDAAFAEAASAEAASAK
jgi:hypothetical protein